VHPNLVGSEKPRRQSIHDSFRQVSTIAPSGFEERFNRNISGQFGSMNCVAAEVKIGSRNKGIRIIVPAILAVSTSLESSIAKKPLKRELFVYSHQVDDPVLPGALLA